MRTEVRVPAYNLLNMTRKSYLMENEIKRSLEWMIGLPIEVGVKAAFTGRSRQIRVRAVLNSGRRPPCFRSP